MKIEISGFKIQKFDSLESTNKYCEALDLIKVEDFTCYWALEQTAGIGQRGNHWESAPGQNLTFSLVLHPTFLPADRQFRLTQALSLAIVDFLSIFNFDSLHLNRKTRCSQPSAQFPISIKWPNDIYVADRKICGTLVSTRLCGNTIASAVCGIGLNVNQCEFPDWVPNPTSLCLLTGKTYELETFLQHLLQCIEARYDKLRSECDFEPEYLQHLLNLGTPARYKYNEEEIEATITGVDPHGRLLLSAADGRSLSCGMKEIALLS